MPEIGEGYLALLVQGRRTDSEAVARIVHYLKKRLAGKTLATVKAQDDANVFGKVGTTAVEFQKAMAGKKVLDAGQQGKYFWLVMSSPPHPVMHFGMTGWIKFRNEDTYYYKPAKEEQDEEKEWPPKFWKFVLETAEEPKCEAAFVDSRRFARIRLLDCDADSIRQTTPLKENGPDPVIDKDVITEEWLVDKMRSKKVPVKALLLDQANFSGIGNWVGDEILYHSRIHPEQYSNTLSDAQLKQLHTSLLHICSTAVDLLADSSKFPEEWLFRHRWGKGKKDQKKELPNGEKIVHITVGGRTSAVVPSVQKKTGPVAGDVKSEDIDGDMSPSKEEGEQKLAKKGKASSKAAKQDQSQPTVTGAKKRSRAKEAETDIKDSPNTPAKKRKAAPKSETVKDEGTKNASTRKKNATAEDKELASGRRRSARVTAGRA